MTPRPQCIDRRKPGKCESIKKRGRCDIDKWGCELTCGRCLAPLRPSPLSLINESSYITGSYGTAGIAPAVAPWLSVADINETAAALRKPEFRYMFVSEVPTRRVREWQEMLDPKGSSLLRFDPRKRYHNCSVVGSSHSLMLRKHGSLIDSADAVIRINYPPVQTSLHRHIGSRTTFFVNNLKLPFRNHPHVANQVIVCNNGECWHHVGREGDGFERISPSVMLLTRRLVRLRYFMARPTTGMTAIVMALQICSNVSAFGFGLLNSSCARYFGPCVSPKRYYSNGFDRGLPSDKKKKELKIPSPHRWHLEKAWLRSGPDWRLRMYS